MPDPSAPLDWPYAKAQDIAREPADEQHFQWPTPPYAAYPQPQPQSAPEPCEILGLNNSRTTGHVILIAAQERVAQVTVPPARSAMPLKFAQFRALKLLRPIPAAPREAIAIDDPLASRE